MPHPVDVAVGARVRELRIRAGFTQQDLAAGLGLSFQQLQKYEKGANRISASRLVAIGASLGVRPESFFEGVGTEGVSLEGGAALNKDASKVARDFQRISDPKVRSIIRMVFRELARPHR